MELTLGLALLLIALSVIIGIVSALFGIGGGILIVPALVILAGFNQHLAEGTSLLIIVPTALMGVRSHNRSGFLSPRHGLLLGSGGMVGAFVGASTALQLSSQTLTRAFGVFTVVMGVRFIVTGRRILRRDSAAE